jgi:HEAT repeat protein
MKLKALLFSCVVTGLFIQDLAAEASFQGKPVRRWLDDLESPIPLTRKRAAMAFAVMGATAKEAVPRLVKALKDKDETVRGDIAFALGRMGMYGKGALLGLKGALSDDHESVRVKAIGAIRGIDPMGQWTVSTLLYAQKNSSSAVKSAAAAGLTRVETDSKAYRKLVAAMTTKDPYIAAAAITAIGSKGTRSKKYASTILRLTEHKNEMVASAASAAMGRVDPDGSAMMIIALRKVKSTNPKYQLEGIQSLVGYGEKAAPAVPVIGKLVYSRDSTVSMAAITALTTLGEFHSDAVKYLGNGLNSKNPETRLAVINALPGLDSAVGVPILPVLTKASKDKAYSVRVGVVSVLSKLEDPDSALPLLKNMLKDPSYYVRAAAATALGQQGEGAKSAIPLLKKLQKDQNQSVKTAAAAAISAIKNPPAEE